MDCSFQEVSKYTSSSRLARLKNDAVLFGTKSKTFIRNGIFYFIFPYINLYHQAL